MRKLIACLVLALAAVAAWGADVQIPLAYFTQNAFAGKRIIVTPTNTPGISGAGIIVAEPKIYTNDADGLITISNMFGPCVYLVQAYGGLSMTPFRILVPNTNALLNATNLIVNVATNPSGSVSYPISASDARYIQTLAGRGTNAIFGAGDTNTATISGAGIEAINGTYYSADDLFPGDRTLTNAAGAYAVNDSGAWFITTNAADFISDGFHQYNDGDGTFSEWNLGDPSTLPVPTNSYFGSGRFALTAVEAALFMSGMIGDGSGLTNITGENITGAIPGDSLPVIPISKLPGEVFTNRNIGFANARDFGATGDGATDDTAALQAALNYIWKPDATNKNLLIPAGKYISSGLYVTNDYFAGYYGISYFERGHIIQGAGSGLTILDFHTTANAKGLSITNGHNSSIQVKDIGFLGPQYATYDSADTSIGIGIGSFDGITAGGSEPLDIRIEDCWIRGWALGVTSSNAWGTVVRGSQFANISKEAIRHTGSHASQTELCRFGGNFGDGHYMASAIAYQTNIHFSGELSGGGDDATILNCDISACTNAILNNGEITLAVVSAHIESVGSLLTATNCLASVAHCSLKNIYFLDQLVLGDYLGVINICAEQSPRLSIENVTFGGSSRHGVEITDYDAFGYKPPILIHDVPITVSFNGATSTLYPIRGDDNANHFRRGDSTWSAPVLASADFANQGTATTVLHGNASGNPSFGSVSLANDVSGNLGVSHLNGGSSASATTFWRGDATWATPAGGGTGIATNSGTGTNNIFTELTQITNTGTLYIGFKSAQFGHLNVVQSEENAILSGKENNIGGLNAGATISGGFENVMGNSLAASTISGGQSNQIITGATFSTIAGGLFNAVGGSCNASVVSGGIGNSAAAACTTVAGGSNNIASGVFSYAAGRRAKPSHAGAFAWADSQDADWGDYGADTFNVRAQGGSIWTGSTSYITNSSGTKPDFTKAYTLVTTNAAFTVLAPSGVDTTKTLDQTTVFMVTNSTATGVQITQPANVHTNGVWYVTNLTTITFFCHAGTGFTNAIALPLW